MCKNRAWSKLRVRIIIEGLCVHALQFLRNEIIKTIRINFHSHKKYSFSLSYQNEWFFNSWVYCIYLIRTTFPWEFHRLFLGLQNSFLFGAINAYLRIYFCFIRCFFCLFCNWSPNSSDYKFFIFHLLSFQHLRSSDFVTLSPSSLF